MDSPEAPGARSRHWLIDAAMGGGLALVLISAAEAALPRVDHLAAQPRSPRPATQAARTTVAPAPAAPPVLVAFQTPAPGYPVISPFGLRELPWEGAGRLHAGVDIAAPAGLPVLAAADGVVTRVAVDPGYGRFVELQHAGGLTSRYAHLGRVLAGIAPGAAVKAGEAVGQIGSTGTSTGAHLHFEIRDGQGRPLNPELFLGRSFAEAKDLPLRAAERIPRGVRVAYVSFVPATKRSAMQAKLDAATAAAAAQAAGDAGSTGSTGATRIAANAQDHGADASAATAGLTFVHGRPQARLAASN